MYKKTGETDEALGLLKKAKTLDENESFCYAYHGLIRLKIAKRDGLKCEPEILEYLERAEALEKWWRIFERYIDLAEYYLYVGDPDKAYEYLEKARSRNEQYGRAWYYRAKYHEAKGEDKEAEDCMAKAKANRFIPDDDD